MTEAALARDEHLISSIAVAVTSGLVVTDPDRALFILAESDKTYLVRCVVVDFGIPTSREEKFDDIRAAIAYFLDLRDTDDPKSRTVLG